MAPTGTIMTCGKAACRARVEANPEYQRDLLELDEAKSLVAAAATEAVEERVGNADGVDDNVCALCRAPMDPNGRAQPLRMCCFTRI